MYTPLARALATLGAVATAGFGIWHFFVPDIWGWYAYFEPAATELVIAVRAINVFFSLALVLFAVMNLALAWGPTPGRFPALVVLGATTLLWAARVAMQVAYPQGTLVPALQYGMLAAFVVVFACFAAATTLVVRGT